MKAIVLALAWILWVETWEYGYGREWRRQEAYETKAECVAAKDEIVRALYFFFGDRAVGSLLGFGSDGIEWRDDEGRIRGSRYSCWPDTVDPRR